ncbi:MAG: choice-of-anchor B family protein [Bacteroidota bacterium]
MRQLFLPILLLFITYFLQAQAEQNATLVGNLRYNQGVNDVWGWADEDGTEYAFVGLQNGVSVVSLADPSNPREAGYAPGPSSGWRDIKTWKGYAYAINETGDGLLVINLNTLPDSITYEYWAPTIDELGTLNTCHNIYIDEFGTAYLAGCNLNGGGVLFVDVDSDPGNPIYVGKADPRYSHDVYVRDEVMYSSDIFAGFFSVADVSNKAEATTMATQNTPFNFTHNAWLSDDSKTIFTTDERGNAPTASYDISDLNNIQKLDEFRPAATINTGVIPHNAHVLNDYLVISHYSDGVVIVDAARPHNMIQVGQYDTYPQPGGGFSGCWGAYPFLPSGLVLGSDRSNGLFVIQPDYVRAAYLEGIVREEGTTVLLSDVKVEINDPNILEETTNLEGAFATGTAESGTYEVTFSKIGFFPKTIEVDLTNGELTELDVELKPTAKFFVRGLVVDNESQNPISRARVQILGEEVSYETNASSDGVFEVEEVIEGDYEIIIGAWGYQQKVADYAADSDQELTFVLEFGYEDDFALDLGWKVEGDAISGNWEFGEPIGTGTPPNFINPQFDVEGDIGNQCYVTGNGGGDGGSDDVDDGTTILISPKMDLTLYNEPILTYQYWLFIGGGNVAANDTLKVKLTNGVDTVLMREHRGSGSFWRNNGFAGFKLKDFIELTDDMRIFFEITDLPDSGHLLEAGIDQFKISEGMPTSTEQIVQENIFAVYPNPFSDDLQLEIKDVNFKNARFEIYDVNARLLYQQQIQQTITTVELPTNLPKGSYWIRLNVDGVYQAAQQLLKQ